MPIVVHSPLWLFEESGSGWLIDRDAHEPDASSGAVGSTFEPSRLNTRSGFKPMAPSATRDALKWGSANSQERIASAAAHAVRCGEATT